MAHSPIHGQGSRYCLGVVIRTVYSNAVIQICSGITCGTVLNGELYAQRLQKLIYLHLSTDCFMKISLHSAGPSEERNLYETVCRQMQINELL